jgi:hypothetical protein
MVVGQAPLGELELLRRFHRVRLVVVQDSGAELVVQRQAVADPMRSEPQRSFSVSPAPKD